MASMTRNLISLTHKRFLSSSSFAAAKLSSPTSPLPTTSTVEFLVNSCGLPLQSALSFSQKLQLDEKNIQNTKSVVHFLKSHDFDNSHIMKLLEKRPSWLHCSTEENLKPKLEFLTANGFVGELLPQLIVVDPSILSRALDSLKHALEFLKSVLGSNDNVVAAIKRSSWLFGTDLKGTVQPNIDFLIKEGVAVDRAQKLFLMYPRVVQQKHDRMVYAVHAIRNMGFEPEAPMFIHALRGKLSMTESNWKMKIEVMNRLGWSDEEVFSAFKRSPSILSYSEEKIRSVMDFFLNTLQLERQILITYPYFLSFSIDKRIRPRYNVIKVLESKDLLRGHKKFPRFLLLSDKKFSDNYVRKYADKVPDLLEIYGGTREEKSQTLDEKKRGMDFFVSETEATNYNGLFLSFLYSIDRRLHPRHNVLKVLV